MPIRPQSRLPPSTPCAIVEMSAACGAASAVRLRPGRALEAEGGVEQVEHRRNDERAEDDAEHQRDLLPPRRRIDQLAGLQILEVVVGDRGDAEDDRRSRTERRRPATSTRRRSTPGNSAREDQRDAEHRQDADAGDRAVRRADEAGHVAAHRGNHDAGNQDVNDAERRSSRSDWPRSDRCSPNA